MAGHETFVWLLLQYDTNPNLEEYGITPLIAASQFGHKGVAKILIEEGGVLWMTGNLWVVEHSMQPWATVKGKMAEFLLEEGASLGGYDLDNNPSTD